MKLIPISRGRASWHHKRSTGKIGSGYSLLVECSRLSHFPTWDLSFFIRKMRGLDYMVLRAHLALTICDSLIQIFMILA